MLGCFLPMRSIGTGPGGGFHERKDRGCDGWVPAVRFLRDGMHVAVLDIRDEAAEHLAAVGHKTGVRVLHIPTDVSSYQQVREAGAKVREEFGRLDVWVNNAGWDRIIPFLSTAPSDWERVVGINLMGVVHGTRVALEGMLAGDAGGAIVNVASDAGRVGSSGEADIGRAHV